MKSLLLKLPQVQALPQGRPTACPKCQHPILQQWGKVKKPIKDIKLQEVTVYRYRCTSCSATFRHYPEGVDRKDQSQRTVLLCALFWGLGLSTHAISLLLSKLEVNLSAMTCWRDVLSTLGEVRRRLSSLNLRVVGVDGVYPRLKGKSRGVVIVVSIEDGIPLAILEADEKDPQALCSKLKPLMDRLGVEVVVTDDLGSYRTMTEELGLRHQVCRFHLRRWARRQINKLKGGLGQE